MTYTIDTCRFLAKSSYYWDRTKTGWLSARIIRLSGISDHDADDLVSQWGSTIKSPCVHTVTSRYPS